jgi:hypothetical protein
MLNVMPYLYLHLLIDSINQFLNNTLNKLTIHFYGVLKANVREDKAETKLSKTSI